VVVNGGCNESFVSVLVLVVVVVGCGSGDATWLIADMFLLALE
jgi:hypothetical protein